MLNQIWMWLLAIGFIIGAVNGRVTQVTQSAMEAAGSTVSLSLTLLGVTCLWTGLMSIAGKAGMISKLARMFRPFLRLVFPDVPGEHPALGSIVMNLAANFLGLGNAATPLGIKAMEELQKINRRKDTASDAMCMFLVLNTSAIQLVPASVIAIRLQYHSLQPAEIMPTIWIASTCAMSAGILAAKVFSMGRRRQRVIRRGRDNG